MRVHAVLQDELIICHVRCAMVAHRTWQMITTRWYLAYGVPLENDHKEIYETFHTEKMWHVPFSTCDLRVTPKMDMKKLKSYMWLKHENFHRVVLVSRKISPNTLDNMASFAPRGHAGGNNSMCAFSRAHPCLYQTMNQST